MTARRTISDLLATDDPAWPGLRRRIHVSRNSAVALPPTSDADACLLQLQVTVHSTLGAIVRQSGGILVDHGWFRLLGSGHDRLGRSLPEWNARLGNVIEAGVSPPLLVVGDDVLGGVFAINGGRFSGPAGHVFYFAPDRAAWEDLDIGYTDFVTLLLTGDVAKFAGPRWPEWQTDAASLPGDHAFSVYPPLIAAGPQLAERSRRPVPLRELVELWGALA